MWNNTGRKMMKLAKLICWLGIALSVLAGVMIAATGAIVSGLLMIALGCLGSWISSWSLYAMGENHEMVSQLKK